jgi:hypothetical protein
VVATSDAILVTNRVDSVPRFFANTLLIPAPRVSPPVRETSSKNQWGEIPQRSATLVSRAEKRYGRYASWLVQTSACPVHSSRHSDGDFQ